MSLETETPAELVELNQIVAANTKERPVQKFIVGFIAGTGLASSVDFCTVNDKINQDIQEIDVIIKSFFKTLDISTTIHNLVATINDLISQLQEMRAQCEPTRTELKEVYTALKNYFKNPSYPQNLINHSVQNLTGIIQQVKNYVLHLKDLTPEEEGYGLGSLVKYVLLWDFQVPTSSSS